VKSLQTSIGDLLATEPEMTQPLQPLQVFEPRIRDLFDQRQLLEMGQALNGFQSGIGDRTGRRAEKLLS
jgi:hypothetical protein